MSMDEGTTAEPTPAALLRELLEGQLLGVLGTQYRGAPYTSLVAVAASEDLRRLFFATSRSTRKFRNLIAESRASVLIDNRDNLPRDFAAAAAVTVLGVAAELEGEARQQACARLLDRHPQLGVFVESPSCAVMGFEVTRYILVRHFQQVVELSPI